MPRHNSHHNNHNHNHDSQSSGYGSPPGYPSPPGYGSPPPPSYASPPTQFVAPNLTLAQMRGIPDPNDLISRNAPSKAETHTYHMLHLAFYGSGNSSPYPNNTECAECRLRAHVNNQVVAKHPQHSLITGVPAAEPFRMTSSPVWVGFYPSALGSTIQGTRGISMGAPPQQYVCDPGVALAHFLGYQPGLLTDPLNKPLTQNSRAGPLIVDFIMKRADGRHIPKPDGTADRAVYLGRDLVYGNCKHESITRFELGYALAESFTICLQRLYPRKPQIWHHAQLAHLSTRDMQSWEAVVLLVGIQ